MGDISQRKGRQPGILALAFVSGIYCGRLVLFSRSNLFQHGGACNCDIPAKLFHIDSLIIDAIDSFYIFSRLEGAGLVAIFNNRFGLAGGDT